MDIVRLTEASDASDAESSLARKPLLQFLRNLGVCLLLYFNLVANCAAQSWNLPHAFPHNCYVVAYLCPDRALIVPLLYRHNYITAQGAIQYHLPVSHANW